MEYIVICVDNSKAIIDDILDSELKVIERICVANVKPSSETQISLMVFSPEPTVKLDFTNNLYEMRAKLYAIGCKGEMDIISGLYIAFANLIKSKAKKKRIIAFVFTLIRRTVTELKSFGQLMSGQCPQLTVDIVCFGRNVGFNSNKLKAFVNEFKQNNSNLYEINSTVESDLLLGLHRTSVLNISDDDFEQLKTMSNIGPVNQSDNSGLVDIESEMMKKAVEESLKESASPTLGITLYMDDDMSGQESPLPLDRLEKSYNSEGKEDLNKLYDLVFDVTNEQQNNDLEKAIANSLKDQTMSVNTNQLVSDNKREINSGNLILSSKTKSNKKVKKFREGKEKD